MKVFEKTYVNLGELKENSKVEVKFKMVKPIKITSMSASCGCTSATTEDGYVVGRLKVGDVPYHLRNVGYSYSSKTITVEYEVDNKTFKDVLRFEYKIVV